MALTFKRVEALKQKPGRHSDEHGLYLQVRSAKNVSWLFRYERNGREHYMGLGPLHTFGLAEARERARLCRQQLADGIDPLQARRKSAEATKTFEECALAFYDGNEARWTNQKHRENFIGSLRKYVFPVIGPRPVNKIEIADVLAVCEKKWPPHGGKRFWDARGETAKRTLNRIDKVLAWATVRGLRSGDNPAKWQGFLSTQLTAPKKGLRHQPALPYGELPAFMADLRQRTGIAARALEFTILTAARTSAVTGATWDEIDLDEKVWMVPPSRAGTKISGGKPRRVPLAQPIVDLLRTLPREDGNPHVFLGPKEGDGLSNAAMASVIDRMNDANTRAGRPRYIDPTQGNADIVPHGFRSTFKDWAAECTHFRGEVSEAALWHVVANKVEAAYRRGDLFEKRRKLMADWARYAYSTPTKADVVPMRAMG